MSMIFKPLCPHCGTGAMMRTCKRLSTTFTEIYCICPNCAASWRGSIEAHNFINPPMKDANGQALVMGSYEFNGEGDLVPKAADATEIRVSRGLTDFEKRQMDLLLAEDPEEEDEAETARAT